MASVNISVRLLSGKLRSFSDKSDTPILAIKKQLEIEQNLPEFYKLSLYVGETELIEGTISEVGLLEAAEVQAVASASIEKPVEVIMEGCAEIDKIVANFEGMDENVFEYQRLLNAIHRIRLKLDKATSFLMQFEDRVHDQVSEVACNLLRRDLIVAKVRPILLWKGHNFAKLMQELVPLMAMSLHLLGKYGSGIVVDDINKTIASLQVHVLHACHDEKTILEFASLVALAKSVMSKISIRTSIQREGEVIDSENNDKDSLGNDKAEVVEGMADNPDCGEALDADVVGSDTVSTQADQCSVDLETAMRESAAAAAAEHGAQVQEAILRSKIDSAQRQNVVVLRLTKRNSDVVDTLLKDECLQKVRAQVEEAGCEVLPDWARGAIVLVPLSEEEATDAGVELRAHHIVVVEEYQSHVERALASIPKKRRPLARRADPEYLSKAVPSDHNVSLAPAIPAYTPNIDSWHSELELEWYVERTFVHCPLPQAEGSSRSVKSEPWGGMTDARPLKLPRLSK